MTDITNSNDKGSAKSIRVRFCYEKRGGACFVPHVSLINLFARSALRAGVTLTMTEGFSPHPKISFGPELPAGVIALGELVDVYLEKSQFEFDANTLANDLTWLIDCIERLNRALPEGFKILGATLPPENSPALGKILQAATYWVRGVKITSDALLVSAKEFYGSAVLDARADQDVESENADASTGEWLVLTLAAPAQNGIGGWVKSMIASGMIAGWHEMNIVRSKMILRA